MEKKNMLNEIFLWHYTPPPSDIATNGEIIVTCELLYNKIKIFDIEYNYLNEIKSPSPCNVKVFQKSIFVQSSGKCKQYSFDGKLISQLSLPQTNSCICCPYQPLKGLDINE